MPHRARGKHHHGHPVHVTMRVAKTTPNLRHPCVYFLVRAAIETSVRDDFRVAHYSVQVDHLHFLVEGDDRSALARGLRALAIRIARAVNAATARKGRVFEERYHARALRTPREVRFGLLYVLMNHKKHLGNGIATLIDRCSSGIWFQGWRETAAPLSLQEDQCPIPRPKTWLLRGGWLRAGGKISVFAAPRPP